jgi:hypothetical protein
MLSKLIATFKKQDPAGFADSLGQYGIDVKGKSPELVCKDHDGNQLRGDAAAQFIGADPGLAAALSASGTLTSMKTAQVELSASVLTEARNHDIPGTHMKASDIITSETATDCSSIGRSTPAPRHPSMSSISW